ncbi:NUDIX hydrolase [Clostridium sp. SYSU_GA19001]|uniref:NUDIX hydrolase n=1 Tax=Clostridium caldaquaticum TaxID=2940653 RepID=UPI0020775B51|nr:NUDIX hydrolase [Clostridium caldaquaticum]MCM8710251.1 NUDIX hydrolase [Clostridium caldaquaticum]
MKTNKIKKLTPLAETKFLSLYDAEYENKKGALKHWIIASRKDFNTLNAQFSGEKEENIDAVVIAAFHEERKSLVLIKQFRTPLNDYVYELPAGLLDEDESIEKAVNRELKEETGLSLIKINYEKTKNKVYISAGMTDESVAMVYCSCKGIVSNKYLEDDEDIEAVLVSQEEAKEMLKKDIKMDIKVWTILQSFALLGEKLF